MFERLAAGLSQHTEGEFYPIDALNQLAADGQLYAVNYEGVRWDTGHVEGYLEAVLAEASRRPQLRTFLAAWAAKHLD